MKNSARKIFSTWRSRHILEGYLTWDQMWHSCWSSWAMFVCNGIAEQQFLFEFFELLHMLDTATLHETTSYCWYLCLAALNMLTWPVRRWFIWCYRFTETYLHYLNAHRLCSVMETNDLWIKFYSLCGFLYVFPLCWLTCEDIFLSYCELILFVTLVLSDPEEHWMLCLLFSV